MAGPGLDASAVARLLNPVLQGPIHKPGRLGFRGELALRLAEKRADQALTHAEGRALMGPVRKPNENRPV